MILNDLIDLVNKEKRKQKRIKAAQNFAVGLGAFVVAALGIKIRTARKVKKRNEEMKEKAVNHLENIKDTVHKKQRQ